MYYPAIEHYHYFISIDYAKKKHNSSVLAMKLRFSCINQSIFHWIIRNDISKILLTEEIPLQLSQFR